MSKPLVTISVATFRRPESLKRLLSALNGLRFAKTDPRVRFSLFDNDENQSARSVFDSHTFPAGWESVYESVTERGLSFVRNRAIELAADCDFIAFIDDDQVAEPDWLDELLFASQKYDAAAVWGRNLPKFDQPPEDFVLRLGYFAKNGVGGGDGDVPRDVAMQMGYFEPPRVTSGGECDYADTNNVLVKVSALNGLRFLPDFNSCGGEDREFFGRFKQAGNKIVWANEAVTYECLPPERLHLRWMMRREYSSAIGYIKSQFIKGAVGAMILERSLKSVVHIAYGFGLWCVGLFLGRHVRGWGWLWIARGAGTIVGLIGGDCRVYS